MAIFIHGGNIHTMSYRGIADAMLVIGDKIRSVGTEDEVRKYLPSKYREIDLAGRAVFPGFHDAHIHFLMQAVGLKRLNLAGVATVDEALQIVKNTAPTIAQGEWLYGRGWDKSLWETFPTRQMLDAVAPAVPVLLTSKCGHATWVNTKALEIAGITRDTETPPGGAILKDDKGEPTGIFQDKASALVRRFIPPATAEFTYEAAAEYIPQLWKMGITCIQAPDQMGLFGIARSLRLDRDLPLRVALMPPVAEFHQLVNLGVPQGYGDDWVWMAQVKMFKDGALGSSSALLFEPYEHVNTTGLDVTPMEDLRRQVRACVKAGYGIAVHAIGDRAVSECLDAIEECEDESRALKIRHRIEHAQMVHPKDIQRFADLGVIASVQPSHAVADRYMADREWGARSDRAYPFRQFAGHGVTMSFGSDAPVDTPDPIYGIHCAVNRNSPGEPDSLSWHPEECLNMCEAVAAYTIDAAYAAGREAMYGDLAPGKLADFVILSEDLFRVPKLEVTRCKVEATCIGGRFVVEAE